MALDTRIRTWATLAEGECSHPCATLAYTFLSRSAVEEWFWFQWFDLLVGLKELMVQLKSCISGRFFNYNCIALTNAFTPSSNPFPT